MLVLSTFTGFGLLDKGFEQNGFITVSAGDIIWGRDIRHFKGIENKFEGVIGGTPCQDFSKARRIPPSGKGLEMIAEFTRIVQECKPLFFLLENVPSVPDISVQGYKIQRFDLNTNEVGSPQNRLRHFQYGYRIGTHLSIKRDPKTKNVTRCVTASDTSRKFSEVCFLQGLNEIPILEDFTLKGKYKLIGNGVNINVASRVASAIKEAIKGTPDNNSNLRFCACGCGREVTGKAKTATVACRQRIFKNKLKN